MSRAALNLIKDCHRQCSGRRSRSFMYSKQCPSRFFISRLWQYPVILIFFNYIPSDVSQDFFEKYINDFQFCGQAMLEKLKNTFLKKNFILLLVLQVLQVMLEKKKTGLKIYCSLIFMFLLLYSTVVRGTSRYKNVIEGEAAKNLF